MKRCIASLWVIIAFLSIHIPAYAQLPNYTELIAMLVDLDGWEACEATGMNLSGPAGDMVNALREYEKDGKSITAQIFVGGMAQGMWAPFMEGYTIDTPECFVKTDEVSGHRVGINHEKEGKIGAIAVLLNTKKKTGVFVVTYENMDYEDALSIARKFSWTGIEKVLE